MRRLSKCKRYGRLPPLTILITIVQSDQMESLERERGWKEEEFDFVLQTLRTVLLKRKGFAARSQFAIR